LENRVYAERLKYLLIESLREIKYVILLKTASLYFIIPKLRKNKANLKRTTFDMIDKIKAAEIIPRRNEVHLDAC